MESRDAARVVLDFSPFAFPSSDLRGVPFLFSFSQTPKQKEQKDVFRRIRSHTREDQERNGCYIHRRPLHALNPKSEHHVMCVKRKKTPFPQDNENVDLITTK